MNDVKKKDIALLLCVIAMLVNNVSIVSATSLTFETMFPQCVDEQSSKDFMGSIRCGCYFLVPNFHFETLKNLVWDALFGSVSSTGEYVVSTIWNNVVNGITDDLFNLNFSALFGRFFEIVKLPLQAPAIFLYGLFSSVFVYLLLITFEFVKTYLIIATAWCLWSEVIFHEIRGTNYLSNARFMSFAIAIVLVVGSIILLAMDISIWRI